MFSPSNVGKPVFSSHRAFAPIRTGLSNTNRPTTPLEQTAPVSQLSQHSFFAIVADHGTERSLTPWH
jgi:hypothetical protein